jgi:hypothetical protein
MLMTAMRAGRDVRRAAVPARPSGNAQRAPSLLERVAGRGAPAAGPTESIGPRPPRETALRGALFGVGARQTLGR